VSAPGTVSPLTPRELERRRALGEDLLLLDVREKKEWAICHIAGSVLVPMSEIATRHAELDPARPVVCICHHGIRSAHVAATLARLGFAAVYNLQGGIERWAIDVDPSMRRY
jgi:rhodanese-related sulfurtransferase